MVCVISKSGARLMPTSERRSRKLLKAGRAKVVHLNPFTIQLLYDSKEYTQAITLGLDMGSQVIGYAVIAHGNKYNKVVFKGEIEQRAYVNAESKTPVLRARANFRRTRRARKWYRKPRFVNRKRGEAKCKACGKNAPSGKALCRPCAKAGHHQVQHIKKSSIWLPPTVKAKADLHLRIIRVVAKFLPIDCVVIETVSFDIHKIINPEVSGEEYQQGEQRGFENIKMFVRFRDRYTCKRCDKKSQRLEVHHIIPRGKNGTDRADNLIVLCSGCHEKVTGKEEEYQSQLFQAIGSTGVSLAKSLAKTACVNSFKEYILLNIPLPHEETFGYVTKGRRKKLGLEKTHANDAIACAVGDSDKPLHDVSVEKICKSARRAVRQQYKANAQKGKGFVRYRQKANQVAGIGRGDMCWHKKKRCRVVIDTLLTTGKFNGKDVETGKRIGSISPQYLKLLKKKRSLIF